MTQLSPEEKAFIRWAIEYLVSENSVHINPEGIFFFRKKFFEEMEAQKDCLNELGKAYYLSIRDKISL